MHESTTAHHSNTQAAKRTCADVRATLRANRDQLAKRYSVRSLGIFGSYARGEERSGSDVDILVEFSKTPNLFEYMDLEQELADILGVGVDLVTLDALKGRIGERIRNEVVWI